MCPQIKPRRIRLAFVAWHAVSQGNWLCLPFHHSLWRKGARTSQPLHFHVLHFLHVPHSRVLLDPGTFSRPLQKCVLSVQLALSSAFNCLGTLLLKTTKGGLPRWSSGSDSQAFNARGAVQSLVGEIRSHVQPKKKKPQHDLSDPMLFSQDSLAHLFSISKHLVLKCSVCTSSCGRKLREFCLGECSLN